MPETKIFIPNFKPLRILSALALCIVCAQSFAGCGHGGKKECCVPTVETHTIAIFPMLNLTETSNRAVDRVDMEDTLADEFVACGDYRIIRAELLRSYIRTYVSQNNLNSLRGSEDIVQIGRELGADLVVTAQLVSYNDLMPPRVGLAVQVYSTRLNGPVGQFPADASGNRLMRAGLKVAYELTPNQNPFVPIFSFETVYDAGRRETTEKLKKYVRIHENKDTGFEPEDAYLMIMRRKYFSFVSSELVCEIFERQNQWAARLEEARRAEKETLDRLGKGAAGEPGSGTEIYSHR